MRDEAGVIAVVIAEGRCEGVLIGEAHHPPTGSLKISAVLGRGEHPEQGQRANGIEERRLLDRLEVGDLRVRTRLRERWVSGIRCVKGRLEFRESRPETRCPVGEERGQRYI